MKKLALIGLLLLGGCTTTKLVPVPYMPTPPAALMERPTPLQTINPSVNIEKPAPAPMPKKSWIHNLLGGK